MQTVERPMTLRWALSAALAIAAIILVFLAIFLGVSARAYSRALDFRDEAWVDVVNFSASRINENHPLLLDSEVLVYTAEHFMNPDYYFVHLHQSDANEYRNFFNENLQNEFNNRIHNLAGRVPELNDREILFGISGAASVLGDSSTSFNLPRGLFYPFDVVYIDGGFRVYRIISDYEHLLYSELVAINNISMDEVMERLRAAVPHESEYMLISRLEESLHVRALLSYVDVYDDGLSFLNIFLGFFMDHWADEVPSRFTFRDAAGNLHDVTLLTRSTFRGGSVLRESVSLWSESQLLMNARPLENYWFEYFPLENMMYVRFRASAEMEGLSYLEFGEMLRDEIDDILQNRASIEKFVIDLRGAGGTWPPPLYGAVEFLNNAAIDNVYILIDNGTRAGGVVSAALLRQMVDNALLIGEPAGHSPNFFGRPGNFRVPYNLPGNRARFTVSTAYWEIWLGYEGDTLMPDIRVSRNIDDHMNSRDTVIETIKSW